MYLPMVLRVGASDEYHYKVYTLKYAKRLSKGDKVSNYSDDFLK